MNYLLTLSLALGSAAALAQTPITITRAQFPATASSVDRYQVISTTGLANPATGPDRTWDYRAVTLEPTVVTDSYASAGAAPPFAGSVRYYDFDYGDLGVPARGYEGFDADGFGDLGTTIPAAQTYSLTGVTGGASDAITYPVQNIATQTLRVPLPMNRLRRTERTRRALISTVLTIQSQNISQASFVGVERITTLDSVAGWGTLRIPVAGSPAGSAAIPVLLEKRRVIEVDSFYLNRQPAPASLLTSLGLTQGARYTGFRYRFFRQNSSQPLLTFIYPTSAYATPSTAAYSLETILGTPAAREVAGGLLAWPNPAAAGQPLHFTLGTVAAGQLLRLRLRDALGRVVAQLITLNGQPAALPPLPAGLYLADAEAADGTRASRRLVLE